MDVLTTTDVMELAQIQKQPCATVYMPTHRKGTDVQQGPIRLRNLLDQVESQWMAQAGLRSTKAREMLEPARALINSSEYWRHQADGLAVFIWQGAIRSFRLPVHFNELAHVSSRFHLKPLFPLLSGNGLFYVLAISQNQVRLLRCTRDSFEEVDSPLLPQSSDVIRQFVDAEKQIQWHTGTAAAPGGKRAAVFHGQGAIEVDYKDRIFEYFRLVADALRKMIRDQNTPLVFAGVEYLYPIFQDANQGLNLLDDFIGGNPDERAGRGNVLAEDLHRSAWSIIEPHLIEMREKVARLYREAAGAAPERAASTLDDAVRAAHDGRVEYLFVPIDAHQWGCFDEATGQAVLHEQPQPGDEDLLDFAAVHTFIHRGTVYAVNREEMPEHGKNVAAVLRY